MPTVRRDTSIAGVTQIVLDAPATGNALSSALIAELAEAIHDADQSGARVLAISSSGRVFCGGFDLREELASDADAGRRFAAIQGVLEALRDSPLVTVALVDGAAYGAGADLVARCDYRVCSERARFRFPGAGFGIVLGLSRLAQIAGSQTARDLALRGNELSASEALACGLASDQVDADGFDGFVAALAEATARLDDRTRRTILRATRANSADEDAALLIASATRPGIAERIHAYAERVRQSRR